MILNRLDIPPPLVYNKNKHFSEDMNYVWNPLREKEGMTVTEENIAAEELAEETANELVPADAPPEGAEEENEPQPLPPEEERIPVHPLTKATVIFGYIASWVNLALLLWQAQTYGVPLYGGALSEWIEPVSPADKYRTEEW